MMVTDTSRAGQRMRWLRAAAYIAIAAAVVSRADRPLWADLGPSFLKIPGVSGEWPGEAYKNWIKVEAHYWKAPTGMGRPGAPRRGQGEGNFSGPSAPSKGESTIVIAVDKRSPVLSQLMDRCLNETPVAEVTYAESSVQAQPSRGQVGQRPAEIPAYFEYKLTDVRVSDCPVVADAPEQAFVLDFKNIQWLNYHGDKEGKTFPLPPAALPPAQVSGITKTFVVDWIGEADDVAPDQCQAMNAKPSEDDYYAFRSPEQAAKERARLAGKGGPNYENGEYCFRGPHQLSVCLLPGIVPDPGLHTPRTTVARGFNLDGDDGTGEPRAGIHRHKNFVSEDGRTKGIDNQLYTIQGCMSGRAGHKGQLIQYANEQNRNGLLSILVAISGIDNEQNDDRVDVTIFNSKDPMVKNALGADILSDYTFRITDQPLFTHFFRRLRGRIVNGAVIIDPVKELSIQQGFSGVITLYDAQMRLEFLPDGRLKGLVGGYTNWKTMGMANHGTSQIESLLPAPIPGVYNALKRAADGLKDPVSGEYHGISTALDIEGVPAFVPPDELDALLKGLRSSSVQPSPADIQAQKAR